MCRYGREAIVEEVLRRQPADVMVAYIRKKDKKGRQAVHRAAEAGQITIMKRLLEMGKMDKLVSTDSGRTLLHVAAAAGQTEVVRYLLEELNIDVNQVYSGLGLISPISSNFARMCE